MSPTREYAGATSIEGKVPGSIPGCSLALASPVCSLDDLAKVTSHGSALTSGPGEVSRDVGRQDAVWSQRKKSPGVTGSTTTHSTVEGLGSTPSAILIMAKFILYIALLPERIFLRLAIMLHSLSFWIWEKVKFKRSGILALAWKFRMRTLGWALSEAESYNKAIEGDDMARTRAQAVKQHEYVLRDDRKAVKSEQTVFKFRDLDNIEVTKIKDTMLGLGSPRGEAEQRDGLRISSINLQSMALNMMVARLTGWSNLLDERGREIKFPRTNDGIKDILGSLEQKHYEELVQVFGTADGRGTNDLPDEAPVDAEAEEATPF